RRDAVEGPARGPPSAGVSGKLAGRGRTSARRTSTGRTSAGRTGLKVDDQFDFFLAAAGRFLRFPIGNRRGARMRASASKRPVTRAQVYKRDSSGVAPASPQIAYRALLDRAGSREPADRGGVDGIGPRHIGLRLACSKALERFLALMGCHLARASEANAALLGSLAALARSGEWRSEMLTARSVAKL